MTVGAVLDWLQSVTFPREKKFADEVYATKTFEAVVQRLINLGTTTCAYYSSIHLEASKILATICFEKGQRAFVGKCNVCPSLQTATALTRTQMDRHGNPDYQEKSAAKSLEDTKDFIRYVRSELCTPHEHSSEHGSSRSSSSASSNHHASHRRGGSSISRTATPEALSALVQPILTPRFAISCSDALLSGLSALVNQEPHLHIQTHLAENPTEVEFTKSLFPFADTYTHVYDHFNLLTPRTILAHCVHLEPSEMELIARRGAGIAHCPTSNFNLRSGASPVGELLDCGINVGLGTDVSGGFGAGILSALREASVSAKVVAMSQRDRLPRAKSREPSRGRSATPVRGSTNLRTVSKTPSGVEKIVEAQTDGTKSSLQILTDGTEVTSEPLPFEQQGSAYDPPASGVPGKFADHQLSIATLFWLATLGGAHVCSLDDRIGNFEVGKEFDALLIQTGQKDPADLGAPSVPEEEADGLSTFELAKTMPPIYVDGWNPSFFADPDDSLADLVEKFLFTVRSLRATCLRCPG